MRNFSQYFEKENRVPFIFLLVLLICNLLYVVLTDVFPFQDLPQHLTYARIFEAYGQSDNLFEKYYQLPAKFTTYYSFHYIIAALATFGGVEVGLKIFLFFYVLSMFLSFQFLVSSIHPGEDSKNIWRGLFFQLVLWNATLGMGFMAFVMAFPFFTLGLGVLYQLFVLKKFNRINNVILGLVLFCLSFCHIVSLFSFIFVALLFLFFCRTKDNLKYFLLMVLFFFITVFGWSGLLGDDGFLNKSFQFDRAINFSYGFGFINQLFRFQWSNPPVAMNYITWNYFGPYRLGLLLFIGAFYSFVGFYLNKVSDKSIDLFDDSKLILFKVWGILFTIGVFLPWGLYIPSEITFINYRIVTLSIFLFFPLLPSRFIDLQSQKNTIAFLSFFSFAIFAFNTFQYQKETKLPFSIIKSIPPKKVLVSMMFQNKSKYFAKILDLTHFLPMYYSIRWNGINQQFWARYTKHLPIDYKRGRSIAGPPDWSPMKFKMSHLKDADYLLLQKNALRPARNIAQIQKAISTKMKLMFCKELWCLYRK